MHRLVDWLIFIRSLDLPQNCNTQSMQLMYIQRMGYILLSIYGFNGVSLCSQKEYHSWYLSDVVSALRLH